MQKSRFSAPSVALLVTLAFAGPAHAQPDTARRDAEARFKEGLARVQGGDFEAARVAFVQAYAVLKSTDVLWNLALSELKSNHPLEALGHFKEYVKDARTSEPDRAKGRKYIDDLNAKVGRVTIDAPAGLTIVVDGKVLPQPTPISEPIDVTPGEHFVEARLGDRSRILRVEPAAGSIVALHFRADELATGAAAAAPAPAPASVPASPAPSASGDGAPPVTAPPDERPTSSVRPILGIALLGAGVVAGAVAGGFALSSSSSSKDADGILAGAPKGACRQSTSPDCAALDDARRSAASKADMAVGFGVAAGALVVSGAVVLLWPKSSGSGSGSASASAKSVSARATVAPIVSDKVAGAALSATF